MDGWTNGQMDGRDSLKTFADTVRWRGHKKHNDGNRELLFWSLSNWAPSTIGSAKSKPLGLLQQDNI